MTIAVDRRKTQPPSRRCKVSNVGGHRDRLYVFELLVTGMFALRIGTVNNSKNSFWLAARRAR
jgi:hypothetical protein